MSLPCLPQPTLPCSARCAPWLVRTAPTRCRHHSQHIATRFTGSSEDTDALLRVLLANASEYNSVSLFNMLPDVAWGTEWLSHVGEGVTGLSVVTGQNYTLTFSKNGTKVRCYMQLYLVGYAHSCCRG